MNLIDFIRIHLVYLFETKDGTENNDINVLFFDELSVNIE